MKNTLHIVRHSKIWFAISGALSIASIVAILVFGLQLGIDFTGGTLMEVKFENTVSSEDVRSTIQELGYSPTTQTGDDNVVIVRMESIDREAHDAITATLQERHGAFEETRFDSIGPVIGKELKQKSIIAVIILLALIVVYVAWSFRTVAKPIASWKYGVLTIVTALHDVLIPLGVFAVLGKVAGYQLDTAFIAAILTILGYSINDTIVIFDRVRENLTLNRHSDEPFSEVVNRSIVQSFGRSINTSLTTLLVLLAVFFFGGVTTKPFILTLIIGIVSGAYSSIFLASPLLVTWEKFTKK